MTIFRPLGVMAFGFFLATHSTTSLAQDGAAPLDTASVAVPDAAVAGVRSVATGGYHTCAISRSGAVFCWGDNSYGQLGDGTTVSRTLPVRVGGLTGSFVSVSAGEGHTCALDTEGQVFCWGSNNFGQLGIGSWIDSREPVLVKALRPGALQISTGAYTTCALDASARVMCWGNGGWGQLGNGVIGSWSNTPSRVIGIAPGARQVSTAVGHACALTGTGRAMCWGHNGFGQLGIELGDYRTTASRVEALQDGLLSISVGNNWTCATTRVRRVKCWGLNTSQQLGPFEEQISRRPVSQTAVPQGVRALTSSMFAACSLNRQRAARCWGDNSYSQLGPLQASSSASPVEVPNLGVGIQALSTGATSRHNCAIIRNGQLRCWGANESGQLGLGIATQEFQPIPTTVQGRLHRR